MTRTSIRPNSARSNPDTQRVEAFEDLFPVVCEPSELRLREKHYRLHRDATATLLDTWENPPLVAVCKAILGITSEFAFGKHDTDAIGKALVGAQYLKQGLEWLRSVDTPEVVSRG